MRGLICDLLLFAEDFPHGFINHLKGERQVRNRRRRRIHPQVPDGHPDRHISTEPVS